MASLIRERFDTFCDELQRQELPANASVAEIYYEFDGKWFAFGGEVIADNGLANILSSALTATSRVGEFAYFPVVALNSVVAVRCASNYKNITIRKISDSLDNILRSANNAYAATHMLLTGLINKVNFKTGCALFCKLVLSQ